MRRQSRQLSVLLVVLCVAMLGLLEHGRIEAQGTPLCFDVPNITNCIEGPFREYWERNGGLAVFGYPITPARTEMTSEGTFLIQMFERNRFELHPEKAPPYNVLLGRLGDDRLRQAGRNWRTFPAGQQTPGCLWFPETGHSVCDQENGLGFKTYWETHGLQDPALDPYGKSLALFGLPLSEPAVERNAAGDTVLTQWFERARFEYHPDKSREFRVLLGLLGNELGNGSDMTGSEQVLCSGAGVTCVAREEGVTITVPPQYGHRQIEVVKLPLAPLNEMPQGQDFEPQRMIINFIIRDVDSGDILQEFNPPMQLQVAYTAEDYQRADKQLTLAFFLEDEQRWSSFVETLPPDETPTVTPDVTTTPTPTDSDTTQQPNNTIVFQGDSQGGFGIGTCYTWGDPNIAWGRDR